MTFYMKLRKSIPAFVALILAYALILFGCGGGGGGGTSTSTTGTTGGPVTISASSTNVAYGQTITLTASAPGASGRFIFLATGGKLTVTGLDSATWKAPSANATYKITAYLESNTNVVGSIFVTVSNFSITINPGAVVLKPSQTTEFSATVSGSSNKAATFSTSGGKLTVLSSTTVRYQAPAVTGVYTVTAQAAADSSLKATARVTVSTGTGGNATLVGTVADQNGGLSGIVVQFYDAGGNQVAQTTTSSGGHFAVIVSVTAKRFNLLPSSINTTNDYESFVYSGLRYAPTVQTCTAPLPALAGGQTVMLPSTISVDATNGGANPPPPPPDGCVG